MGSSTSYRSRRKRRGCSSRDPDSIFVTDFVYRRQFGIEWGHCDPAGIVFNARFFEFFDRSAWLMFEAALGVPLHDLFKVYDIVGIPLVGAQAKFLAPAAFGDLAEMESRIIDIRRSSFDVEHRMFIKAALVVEGLETRVWAARHPDDPLRMKAQPIPKDVVAKFKDI
ncbi:MAG: acyl-CoA thioesterase [Rhizobiales bacterium]|nr:acyl-CoA thioesterase [Hyphomicrobiales bacterium]